jgi:hypothetical protein
MGRGSEEIHRGGELRVSAKERAKRTAAREFRRRFVMAEQLELRALMAADLGLDPTLCQQPVAAEVGVLAPGKAADAISMWICRMCQVLPKPTWRRGYPKLQRD